MAGDTVEPGDGTDDALEPFGILELDPQGLGHVLGGDHRDVGVGPLDLIGVEDLGASRRPLALLSNR